jgi:hypothetical protein
MFSCQATLPIFHLGVFYQKDPLYVVLNSAPPKKKQRGTRGRRVRGKVQKVSVEDMENAPSGEEDIVQDLQLSDFE